MGIEHIAIRPPDASEFAGVLQLRFSVLDGPLGLAEKTTPSTQDINAETIHMAAFDGEALVSTARFDQQLQPDVYLVRRMATSPAYRAKGIGGEVMKAAEALAQERGGRKIVLHARLGAVSFYEKLGYTPNGNDEHHDGILNIGMEKEW